LIGLKPSRRNVQEKARRWQYKVMFPTIILAHWLTTQAYNCAGWTMHLNDH
jgi:hypothetical protein